MRGSMDANAVADLWLGHQIKTDVYGYRDIMRRKTDLLVLVGAGDRLRGIAGVAERLFGEAGARKAWDEEVIRAQHEALQRGREQAGRLAIQLAAARADHDRIAVAPLEIAIPDPEPLPQVIQDMLSIDETTLTAMSHRELSERMLLIATETAATLQRGQERTNELITAATTAADARIRDLATIDGEITRLTDQRREAERFGDRAELAMEKLQVRGKTKPISDLDPTTAELRVLTGDRRVRAPEDETWQQLLDRLGAGGATMTAESCRAWLNQPELVALTGLPARRLQRIRVGEGTSRLALALRRARWADLGPKLWFVNADTLPLHLFLPTQLEALAEQRRVPMGTHHGGRRRSDAEIEAAESGLLSPRDLG
jgi:hypothetical protein